MGIIVDKLNKNFASTQEFATIIEEAVKEEIARQLQDTTNRIQQLENKVSVLEVKVNSLV